MKHTISSTALKYRYYKAIRGLALTALVCTTLLTVFIFIQSLLPSDASGAQSGIIGDAIQSILGKDDQELDASMPFFGSFSLFIRKGFGHFLLFAILGVGLTACAFLLIKPRALYPFIALASGLLIAMLSEAFQLPIFTTGRFASWKDVGIDFFGALCGTSFASMILWLYVMIKNIVDKEKFLILKKVFTTITPRSIVKNYGMICAVYSDEYMRNNN